jgi:hypothetical protein
MDETEAGTALCPGSTRHPSLSHRKVVSGRHFRENGVTVAENVAIPPDAGDPARRGPVRIYVDSTEVQHPSAATGKLGRIADPKLHAATRAVGMQLCVPDLVIDEIARRRLRHLKRDHGKVLKLADGIRDHVSATIEDLPSDEELLAKFRKEVIGQLTDLKVEVVRTDTMPLGDVLALSLRRERPFVGKGEDERDPTGFHDAVILLASLRDARETGTDHCYFVSADDDHSAEAIERVAEQHGVTCVFFRSTADLTESLDILIEAKVDERADAVLQLATEYMGEHTEVIQAALERMQPIRVADLVGLGTGTLRRVTGLAIAPGSVRAAPHGVRRAGMEAAPVAVWFDAVVRVVVTEVVSTPLPEEQEPVRPGLELSGVVLHGFGALSFDGFRAVESEKEITVPMRGTAIAPRFDGTRYRGEPTIESLEVSRPGLSEALVNPFAT